MTRRTMLWSALAAAGLAGCNTPEKKKRPKPPQVDEFVSTPPGSEKPPEYPSDFKPLGSKTDAVGPPSVPMMTPPGGAQGRPGGGGGVGRN